MRFRTPESKDLDKVMTLLADAGLPTADLTLAHLALVADNGTDIIAAVGLESFGELALLRSLVVSSSARNGGLGRRLVDALERQSRDNGVRELWLLTIDADPFFARLGYAVRKREDAPEAIRGTQEFSELCPGDAVLMSKRLQVRL